MASDCKSDGFILRWFESNHSHQNIVFWRNWQTRSRICESDCLYVKFSWIFIIGRWSCRFESDKHNVLYTAVSPSGKASDLDSDSILCFTLVQIQPRQFIRSHRLSVRTSGFQPEKATVQLRLGSSKTTCWYSLRVILTTCFLYLEILCLLFIFAQVGLSICPYLLLRFFYSYLK